MSSIINNNELKNRIQQRSNSGLTTASTSETPTFKKRQQDDNKNNNTREEQEAKSTKRRRTKVGLNDTLRRIRHLIVEGRSNTEIQNTLQLKERTFYRYMAKIYEIDQALFDEQEKKTLITQIGILKDRWLKAYRWYDAMADNENIKADIRMKARQDAAELALALFKLEIEGPRLIKEEQLAEKLYQNSKYAKR